MDNYNEILRSNEKQSRSTKPFAPMLAFKEALLHCGLEDLGYQGYTFTWRNGRPGAAFIEQRLDRVCATTAWQAQFAAAKVVHLQVSYSDHDPILLNTHYLAQWVCTRRRRIQRFKERWESHEECEHIIKNARTQHHPNGSPMFKLFEKIKHCQMKLVAWSREVFGNTRHRLEAKQNTLEVLTTMGYGDNLDQISKVRGGDK